MVSWVWEIMRKRSGFPRLRLLRISKFGLLSQAVGTPSLSVRMARSSWFLILTVTLLGLSYGVEDDLHRLLCWYVECDVPFVKLNPVDVIVFAGASQLFTWGWNQRGTLGHQPTTKTENVPSQVNALVNVNIVQVYSSLHFQAVELFFLL